MTSYGELAAAQAGRQFDPKARKPETDPVIKAALAVAADRYERRSKATGVPSMALALLKASYDLRNAADVEQAIFDRAALRRRLQGCRIGTPEGNAHHDSLKEKLAELHRGFGASPADGERFLDEVDRIASGQFGDLSYDRHGEAQVIGGRILVRIAARNAR